jgi:hypothetical protein
LFGWNRKEKGDKTRLQEQYQGEELKEGKFTEEEQRAVALVTCDYETARAVRESESDESGFSIEDNWEDEYYIYKGGGLQWLTNFARRSKRARRVRPNSEDNFVFNAITVQHANITANYPEISIFGVECDDEDISMKLTDVSRFNDKKNCFKSLWKKLVYDFLGSGPTIAKVIWDNNWIGGRGPERWIGDVRIQRVDKWDFYPDPAITNLEEHMQDCSFIICRYRKKLKYIRDNWENGKFVGQETNEDELIDEGADPQQAYIVEHWHKGFPWFVTDERRKELNEKAFELEQEGDTYKANDYYDSAKGELEGIHVAYIADGVLLEYRAYEYEETLRFRRSCIIKLTRLK